MTYLAFVLSDETRSRLLAKHGVEENPHRRVITHHVTIDLTWGATGMHETRAAYLNRMQEKEGLRVYVSENKVTAPNGETVFAKIVFEGVDTLRSTAGPLHVTLWVLKPLPAKTGRLIAEEALSKFDGQWDQIPLTGSFQVLN